MKVRLGFVSNSSSCSFIVLRNDLSDKQIKFLSNPEEFIRNTLFFTDLEYSNFCFPNPLNSDDINDLYEDFKADKMDVYCQQIQTALNNNDFVFHTMNCGEFAFNTFLTMMHIPDKNVIDFLNVGDGYTTPETERESLSMLTYDNSIKQKILAVSRHKEFTIDHYSIFK